MKKILAIFAVTILLVSCGPKEIKAQTYAMTSPNISILSGGTSYLSVQGLQQSYSTLAIQTVITRLSGTIGGSAYLQGSNDGINYKTLTIAAADTFAIANAATATHIWKLTSNPYYYYRVMTVGAGTTSATQAGLFLPRN